MNDNSITAKGMSVLLSLVLILGLAIPAFAEGLGSGTKTDPFVTEAVFSIGSTTANAGDDGVTIPVSVVNFPDLTGYGAMGLEFTYDTSALTMTNISLVAGVPGTLEPNPEDGFLNMDWRNAAFPDGEFLILEFSIDPDTAGGDYAIGVGLSDAAWVNDDGEYLTATAFNSGTITVTESPDRGVCTYDGENYMTVMEAIDAIMGDNGTGTITMTKDTTILEFSDRIIIPNGANITLDVNGRTINSEVASGEKFRPHCIVDIEPGGSLNLVDESLGAGGKIICITREEGSSFLLNSGNLNMNNINVENFIYGIQDGSTRSGGTAGTYGTISNCKLDTGGQDAMDFCEGEVDTIENCEILTKGYGIIIGHDYQGGSINLIENCTLENSDWNAIPLVFVKHSGAIETIKECNITHHDASAISVQEAKPSDGYPAGRIGIIDGGFYIGGGSYGSAITSGGTIDHVLGGIFIGGWDAVYNRGNINTISGGSFFGNESALTNGGAIDSLEGGYYKTATNSNWIVVEDGSTCTSPEGYNLSTVPMRPSDFDGKEGYYHFGETVDITWNIDEEETIDKFVIGDPVYYGYNEPAIEGGEGVEFRFKGWNDGVNQYRPGQSLPVALEGGVTYTAVFEQIGSEEDYQVYLETEVENINAGEEFTVDVIVSSEGNENFYGATVVIGYDKDMVEFDSSHTTYYGFNSYADGNTETTRGISGGQESGYTLVDGSYKIASIGFKAKTTIDSGKTKAIFSIEDNPVVDQQMGFASIGVEKGEDITVNLYNLTVTFTTGENITMGDVIAYVRYDEEGLYADNDYEETFVEPSPEVADHYTFKGWKLGNEYFSFEDIKDMTFTENTTFVATATPGGYTIDLPDCVEIISGVEDDQIIIHGTDVVFTVTAAEGYQVNKVTYTVGEGEAEEIELVDGKYTIPGEKVTGNITVNVTQHIAGSIEFIAGQEFNSLPADHQLLVLTVADKLDGSAYEYNEDSMFYSSKYSEDGEQVYLYIVPNDVTEAEAREAIQITEGPTCYELRYDGDINLDGKVISTDAVIVFALYQGLWEDKSFPVTSKENMQARLEADVNGDKVVDTTDAQKILDIIWGNLD